MFFRKEVEVEDFAFGYLRSSWIHIHQAQGGVGGGGGGGLLPIMANTGRLRPKGLPFSDFRYQGKGSDFTCWSTWKGRGICHFFVGERAQRAEQMNFMAL